jgi:hypothetical protein
MGNQEIDYRLLSMIIGNSRYLFAENSATGKLVTTLP